MKRLKNDLGDRAHVLRLDIHSEIGREVADRYSSRSVPAFIVFDADGQIIWRGSTRPSVETVLGEG